MISFCGITPGELEAIIGQHGYTTEQAKKVTSRFYRSGIHSFDEMQGIPITLIRLLVDTFNNGLPVIRKVSKSSDGSVKYLYRSDRGLEFESVFIPDGKRNTVCVSSQCGCKIGCPFCLTGSMGFRGDLSAGEIVAQVLSLPDYQKVTNIVFMGMGEPMDNLQEVMKACKIFTSEWGLAIGTRNITVSTAGLTKPVTLFLEKTRYNLTISLFSPFPEERREMIPSERANPVSSIIELVRKSQDKRRRYSLAYVMIEGINDTDRHLDGLKELVAGSGIRINLLPYHGTSMNGWQSSKPERMLYFKHELVISGISASVRRSRGTDISAACGLLATGKED